MLVDASESFADGGFGLKFEQVGKGVSGFDGHEISGDGDVFLLGAVGVEVVAVDAAVAVLGELVGADVLFADESFDRAGGVAGVFGGLSDGEVARPGFFARKGGDELGPGLGISKDSIGAHGLRCGFGFGGSFAFGEGLLEAEEVDEGIDPTAGGGRVRPVQIGGALQTSTKGGAELVEVEGVLVFDFIVGESGEDVAEDFADHDGAPRVRVGVDDGRQEVAVASEFGGRVPFRRLLGWAGVGKRVDGWALDGAGDQGVAIGLDHGGGDCGVVLPSLGFVGALLEVGGGIRVWGLGFGDGIGDRGSGIGGFRKFGRFLVKFAVSIEVGLCQGDRHIHVDALADFLDGFVFDHFSEPCHFRFQFPDGDAELGELEALAFDGGGLAGDGHSLVAVEDFGFGEFAAESFDFLCFVDRRLQLLQFLVLAAAVLEGFIEGLDGGALGEDEFADGVGQFHDQGDILFALAVLDPGAFNGEKIEMGLSFAVGVGGVHGRGE